VIAVLIVTWLNLYLQVASKTAAYRFSDVATGDPSRLYTSFGHCPGHHAASAQRQAPGDRRADKKTLKVLNYNVEWLFLQQGVEGRPGPPVSWNVFMSKQLIFLEIFIFARRPWRRCSTSKI
jgi:hypothetical protein